MNELSLTLNERTIQGKKVAQLRRSGVIPSVVYGGKAEPIVTQSPFIETSKLVQAAGQHTPVKLTIGSKQKLAMIKEIELDPVRRRVRHVAFHAVKQNEKITTQVPIALVGVGESEAEKQGLIVLQALDLIEIKAVPAKLPESLSMTIASLATADDKLTIADIQLPDGVEFADLEQDLDIVVANVYEPSALQAANDAAAGDAEDAVLPDEEGATTETGDAATPQ